MRPREGGGESLSPPFGPKILLGQVDAEPREGVVANRRIPTLSDGNSTGVPSENLPLGRV